MGNKQLEHSNLTQEVKKCPLPSLRRLFKTKLEEFQFYQKHGLINQFNSNTVYTDVIAEKMKNKNKEGQKSFYYKEEIKEQARRSNS